MARYVAPHDLMLQSDRDLLTAVGFGLVGCVSKVAVRNGVSFGKVPPFLFTLGGIGVMLDAVSTVSVSRFAYGFMLAGFASAAQDLLAKGDAGGELLLPIAASLAATRLAVRGFRLRREARGQIGLF